MKLKNALKKIIHSVCLISVLFLSVFFVLPPVESYASSVVFPLVPIGVSNKALVFTGDYEGTSYSFYIFSNASLPLFYYFVVNSDYTLIYIIHDGSFTLPESQEVSVQYYLRGSLYDTWRGQTPIYSGVNSIYYTSLMLSNPNSSFTTSILAPSFSSVSEAVSAFNDFISATPTPDPSTPTPAPATPTPTVSTPTPAADPNAEAFFGKLGSDAQNGVGAIMTAWTAANSHFYTSVLFIVLPVFLGIVGLIASFFFGGGDDD